MAVVAAYAPGEQGDAALRAAVREAHQRQSDLVIISHAYHHPDHGLTHAERADATRALHRIAAAFSPEIRRYLESLELVIDESSDINVGDRLNEIAERRGAELLIVGLRRKSLTGKLNLGQAVRKLILGAPCPVLVVKPDEVSGA